MGRNFFEKSFIKFVSRPELGLRQSVFLAAIVKSLVAHGRLEKFFLKHPSNQLTDTGPVSGGCGLRAAEKFVEKKVFSPSSSSQN